MHRSGTGLLAELLDDLGVFMGARVDSSHEALFFQHLNRWLLDQAPCSWDRPEAFDDVLADGELRALIEEYVDNVLSSPRVVSYLGLRDAIRYRDPRNLPRRWGWKDPRNTLTLPIWEGLMGSVDVVHIVRHGVDVARSLKERREERLNRRASLFEKFQALAWLPLPRDRFVESTRTSSLDGGFSLWQTYVDCARKHLGRLNGDSIEVRYEELLQDPDRILREVTDGLGLDPSSKAIDAAAERIRPGRSFAYRDAEELVEFAQRHSQDLSAYGYEP